jgi:hypothetical protein
VVGSIFCLASIVFPGAAVVFVVLVPIWIWMFVWAVMGQKKVQIFRHSF